MLWITTSWDDGHILDRRLVDLLNRCGLRGTFYVARDCVQGTERLSDADIQRIATEHEFGSHTLTHPVLTQIDPTLAHQEIRDSRRWLQDVTGQPITAFCYPKGIVNAQVRDWVEEAGYTVARTTRLYDLTTRDDPLLLPTTSYVFPFPFSPRSSYRPWYEPIAQLRRHVFHLRIPILAMRSWSSLALALLERADQRNRIFHLWGHSWEIEQYGLWADLERVLSAASRYPNARPVTNSELIASMARNTPPR